MRVAILGCGVVGPVHGAALALDRRVQVAWCADPILDRALALAGRHGARATPDPAEVFADPTVDLVCVASPHHLHADQACAALATGKHVVVEKPLATTPADIDRILTAATAADRRVMGILQHRHSPVVRRLHDLLAQGAFGAVRHASLEFRCTRDAAYYASAPWRGTWAGEGGALLINQAIHHLDLLTDLIGEPRSVLAQVARRRGVAAECEDWAELVVDYPGGVPGRLRCVNDGATGWYARLTVEAAAGRFTLDQDERFTDLAHASDALTAELSALACWTPDLPPAVKACYGVLHAVQYADVINGLANARTPLVDGRAAAVTNRLVLAAYHSAATGQTASLSAPSASFRRPGLIRDTP